MEFKLIYGDNVHFTIFTGWKFHISTKLGKSNFHILSQIHLWSLSKLILSLMLNFDRYILKLKSADYNPFNIKGCTVIDPCWNLKKILYKAKWSYSFLFCSACLLSSMCAASSQGVEKSSRPTYSPWEFCKQTFCMDIRT